MATKAKSTAVKTTKSTTSSTPAGKKSNKTLYIVLGVGAGLLCLCVLCVVGIILIGQQAGNNYTSFLDDFTEQLDAEIKSNLGGDDISSTISGLPENFPTDVPIMPGSEVTYNYAEEETGYISVSLSAAEAESADEVTSYYKTNLPNDDWVLDETFDFGNTIFADKGTRSLTVSASEYSGDVTFVIVISEL